MNEKFITLIIQKEEGKKKNDFIENKNLHSS